MIKQFDHYNFFACVTLIAAHMTSLSMNNELGTPMDICEQKTTMHEKPEQASSPSKRMRHSYPQSPIPVKNVVEKSRRLTLQLAVSDLNISSHVVPFSPHITRHTSGEQPNPHEKNSRFTFCDTHKEISTEGKFNPATNKPVIKIAWDNIAGSNQQISQCFPDPTDQLTPLT
jgi:hypothetical protein